MTVELFQKCAYCAYEDSAENLQGVPPSSGNNGEWGKLEQKHGSGCKWAATRGFTTETHHSECPYCGYCPAENVQGVPLSDASEWAELEERHGSGCEWVCTKAFTTETHQASAGRLRGASTRAFISFTR